jgi:uncharacterized protein with von Willebrand factor type A (vWA) domain
MTKNTPASTLTFDDLSDYQQQAMEYSGCAIEEAYKVERIMRDDIFHSTLDWQSEAELRRGARKAYKMYQENRADYDEMFDTFRAAAEQFFAETAARNEAQITA